MRARSQDTEAMDRPPSADEDGFHARYGTGFDWSHIAERLDLPVPEKISEGLDGVVARIDAERVLKVTGSVQEAAAVLAIQAAENQGICHPSMMRVGAL